MADDLPCDCDGSCMACHTAAPPMTELLMCFTCFTLWHLPCLSKLPSLAGAQRWTCPDCSGDGDATAAPPAPGAGNELVPPIEGDEVLPEREKKRRRQELHAAGSRGPATDEEDGDAGKENLQIQGENFRSVICMNVLENPITTPCGHNSCMKCFEKWIGDGNKKCATCQEEIPRNITENPTIKNTIVDYISTAKI